MNKRACLTITFTSDWLASTGGTGGGDFDDLVQRGPDGLPVVPMSSVKGVLRETAKRLVWAGVSGWDKPLVETLFGRRSKAENRDATTAGALIFSGEARLPDAERLAFGAVAQAKAALFTRRASTAINEKGTAREHTLRAIETAVPMELKGTIRLNAEVEAPADWIDKLNVAAAWTLAVGKGKADGLGRVILQVEANDRPATAAVPSPQSRRLVVELQQTEKATFSVRSATEGAHDTRLYVPGSVLLGWAARKYKDYHDKFEIFHSGKVRFGDARPLTATDEILWPMPQVVREPKHQRGGVDKKGRLDKSKATVRDPKGETPHIQRERVTAPLVSTSGQTEKLPTTLALRTAMQDGRPAAGQLFGYVSLTAAPDISTQSKPTTRRYRAEIEIDADLDEHDWMLLQKAFNGTELLLGRARAAGQGGVFRSQIVEETHVAAGIPLPTPHNGRVVVLALSDLALLNKNGQPDLAPLPHALGVGEGSFIAAESAISTRRYAPWNAHLNTRDVEHCVVEAGSVLVFTIDQAARTWPTTVGLYQELGLGRIWIDPPLLKNLLLDDAAQQGDCVVTLPDKVGESIATLPGNEQQTAAATATLGPEPPLAKWANERARSRETKGSVRDIFERDWRPRLQEFYGADPVGEGPSPSQWSDICAASEAARDIASLRDRLRGDEIARNDAWKKEVGTTQLRAWLGEALESQNTSVARALLKLARDAADQMRRTAKEVAR